MAAVSRLNLLWTAARGVIEIVGMIQRRQELLEVSDRTGAPTTSTSWYNVSRERMVQSMKVELKITGRLKSIGTRDDSQPRVD